MYEAGRGAAPWLRPPFSVDGWRIDVANMLGRLGPDQLGPDVARGMRAAVKAEDPDAYLLGEHSYDAIDHLGGDQWDAVMNYWGFQRPVLELAAGRRVPQPRRAASSIAPSAPRPRRWSRPSRVPGRDPWSVVARPVQPARQPRHRAPCVRWVATRAAIRAASACCDVRRRAVDPVRRRGRLEVRRRHAGSPHDALGPSQLGRGPLGVRPLAGPPAGRLGGRCGRGLPGPRGRRDHLAFCATPRRAVASSSSCAGRTRGPPARWPTRPARSPTAVAVPRASGPVAARR
jgi:hypothetical protein